MNETNKNNTQPTYEAIWLANADETHNKGGFKTKEDAWNYVLSFRCELCTDEYDACSAEWTVLEEWSV